MNSLKASLMRSALGYVVQSYKGIAAFVSLNTKQIFKGFVAEKYGSEKSWISTNPMDECVYIRRKDWI